MYACERKCWIEGMITESYVYKQQGLRDNLEQPSYKLFISQLAS